MWGRAISGVVCCLVGVLWIGQGTNLVHGSFMSGRSQWTVIGAVLVAAGAALLTSAWRRRRRRA
jgi:uncharacterized membrane protein HdeD (DUF308 family)